MRPLQRAGEKFIASEVAKEMHKIACNNFCDKFQKYALFGGIGLQSPFVRNKGNEATPVEDQLRRHIMQLNKSIEGGLDALRETGNIGNFKQFLSQVVAPTVSQLRDNEDEMVRKLGEYYNTIVKNMYDESKKLTAKLLVDVDAFENQKTKELEANKNQADKIVNQIMGGLATEAPTAAEPEAPATATEAPTAAPAEIPPAPEASAPAIEAPTATTPAAPVSGAVPLPEAAAISPTLDPKKKATTRVPLPESRIPAPAPAKTKNISKKKPATKKAPANTPPIYNNKGFQKSYK